jgi:nicotinamidase-related amidase
MTEKNMSKKTALLIVDMLNDFVQEGAALEVPAAKGIVDSIRRRLDEARKESQPIIYICDAHEPADEEFRIWPPHAVKGTKGAEVIAELAPHPGELVVHKKRYSGFFESDLNERLKQSDVSELIITGVLTNICVLYTSADAVSRGYRVHVPENCVAAASHEDHRWALEQMEKVLNVDII